jgi:hypothetical protein
VVAKVREALEHRVILEELLSRAIEQMDKGSPAHRLAAPRAPR